MRTAVGVLWAALLLGTAAHAQVYVDADATGANDGTTWDNAYDDLSVALGAVSSGEVWVAESTYKPTATTDRSVSLTMVTGVDLYGGFGGIGTYETTRGERDPVAHPTVLSGDIGVVDDHSDNSYHVLIGASNATLDGFTLTRGQADGSPGVDTSGAAILNDSVTAVEIVNCRIVSNVAQDGAIKNSYGSVTVRDCIFESNALAIYNWAGQLLVEDCVFANNDVDYGGGVYLRSAIGTVSNCVFVGNGGSGDASGGVGGFACTLELTNCTLCGNLSEAIELNGDSATATVTNCIFRDNGGGIDIVTKMASVCTVSASGIAQVADFVDGGGNIYQDPMFVDPTDPDGPDDVWLTADDGLALQAGSLCIDAADDGVAPTADILGNPRLDDPGLSNVYGGGTSYVDMGAYEFQGTSPDTPRPVIPAPSGCGSGVASPGLLLLAGMLIAALQARRRSCSRTDQQRH